MNTIYTGKDGEMQLYDRNLHIYYTCTFIIIFFSLFCLFVFNLNKNFLLKYLCQAMKVIQKWQSLIFHQCLDVHDEILYVNVCLLVLSGQWFGSWYSAYAGNKTDPNNTVILCFFVVICFHGLAENEMFVKKS